MPEGILIFGANGSGKTTLGREVARTFNRIHLDAEDYYFEVSEIPFSNPRSKQEVIQLMLADIEAHGSFVLTSVMGGYGDQITSLYQFAVLLSAPLDVRVERVIRRSQNRFGKRVVKGGDLYEQEQEFFEFVRTRDLSEISDWAETLTCPVFQLDGTKSVLENTRLIVEQYRALRG